MLNAPHAIEEQRLEQRQQSRERQYAQVDGDRDQPQHEATKLLRDARRHVHGRVEQSTAPLSAHIRLHLGLRHESVAVVAQGLQQGLSTPMSDPNQSPGEAVRWEHATDVHIHMERAGRPSEGIGMAAAAAAHRPPPSDAVGAVGAVAAVSRETRTWWPRGERKISSTSKRNRPSFCEPIALRQPAAASCSRELEAVSSSAVKGSVDASDQALRSVAAASCAHAAHTAHARGGVGGECHLPVRGWRCEADTLGVCAGACGADEAWRGVRCTGEARVGRMLCARAEARGQRQRRAGGGAPGAERRVARRYGHMAYVDEVEERLPGQHSEVALNAPNEQLDVD